MIADDLAKNETRHHKNKVLTITSTHSTIKWYWIRKLSMTMPWQH